MTRKFTTMILLILCLVACQKAAPAEVAVPTVAPTVSQPAPRQPDLGATAGADYVGHWQGEALQTSLDDFAGLTLPQEKGVFFSGAGACAACHRTLKDPAGNDVSMDRMWRSSMLANAARDPYWRATVRSEVNQAPQIADVIQKKCATCHMPMAEVSLVSQQQPVALVDGGLFDPANPLHVLGNDGISCTLCHQIDAANLGAAESFSGGFLINTDQPMGERLLYGPYTAEADMIKVMQGASGFIPEQGLHLAKAEVCGNCHDLYTPYLDASGAVAGEFAEQLIYSEWVNSAFAEKQTCQDCHMPAAEGGVKLSITGGPLREPFSQHVLVGGNAYMARLMQQNGETLQVAANPQQFQDTIVSTLNQIATQTASLKLEQVRLENDQLLADVLVENLAGHKFPAGFPSRRAWLHIRVFDLAGNLIFESGAVNEQGAIDGNDNDLDPARFEPHYTTLSQPDQVQIYEGIMADTEGQVTTTLLRGAVFIKDNRLLPAGFQANPQIPAISPAGDATNDPDFSGGQDRLHLQIDIGQAQGPFTLQVNLLYQTIAYRWAQNLALETGAEIEQFSGFYSTSPNLPLVAASAQASSQPAK